MAAGKVVQPVALSRYGSLSREIAHPEASLRLAPITHHRMDQED